MHFLTHQGRSKKLRSYLSMVALISRALSPSNCAALSYVTRDAATIKIAAYIPDKPILMSAQVLRLIQAGDHGRSVSQVRDHPLR